jgi:hypothetical protein
LCAVGLLTRHSQHHIVSCARENCGLMIERKLC